MQLVLCGLAAIPSDLAGPLAAISRNPTNATKHQNGESRPTVLLSSYFKQMLKNGEQNEQGGKVGWDWLLTVAAGAYLHDRVSASPTTDVEHGPRMVPGSFFVCFVGLWR